MEAEIGNPSHVNRFHVDGMHNTSVVEWSKKRKPQSDRSDMLRPKHKCWVGNSTSSEPAIIFGESPLLGSMHIHLVEGGTNAILLDDSSEPESVKDSNSLTEDSNTAMSINEEGKVEATFIDWDSVETVSSSKEEKFVDNEYNPPYEYADLHALKNLEEHFPGLGSCADHMYSEYAKDSMEESLDKEFEDVFYSKVENPNMFVLSSGRWDVNQEAESITKTPTIDQEFEQYFSMLML